MSTIKDDVTENEVHVSLEKRAFMKKFGKYAAVSAGMAVLMTPTLSSAISSANNGKGNGIDPLPSQPSEGNNAGANP